MRIKVVFQSRNCSTIVIFYIYQLYPIVIFSFLCSLSLSSLCAVYWRVETYQFEISRREQGKEEEEGRREQRFLIFAVKTAAIVVQQ